jgi:hypothetical protein
MLKWYNLIAFNNILLKNKEIIETLEEEKLKQMCFK